MWKLNTRRLPINRTPFTLVIVLLAFCNIGFADDQKDETLRILADDFRGSINGGALASGNVELTQGSLKIQADTLTLQVEGEIFEGIEATGNPVLLQLSLDSGDEQRIVHAEATSVVYSVTEEQIEFEGDAKVESDELSIAGNKIRLNVRENQIEAESLDSDNQVEVILHDFDADKTPPSD